MSSDGCGNCAGSEGAGEDGSTARIARAFDRQSAELSSDSAKWPKPSPVTLRLLGMLDDVAEARPTLLEIGCGTGAASVRLAQQGARQVTGIDLSSASVDIAVKRAATAGLDPSRVRFAVGDGASSPLEQHDWVLLDRVICCYPSVERLLASALGAVGSRLAFAVPESRGWRGRLNRVGWATENLWGAVFRRSTCPGHVHDLDAIHQTLADAGLHLVGEAHRGLWYAAVFARTD